MAKKQSFAEKTMKKAHQSICPVCGAEMQYVRRVKALKTDAGSWKFRSVNVGVCKCNEKEIYA